MDDATRTELEAAAFRRLVGHLRERTDVQNIDLMNLAGFCRNCLSNWYQEAAQSHDIELDNPQAREIVYGMPYDEWKKKYQTEATEEQKGQICRIEQTLGRRPSQSKARGGGRGELDVSRFHGSARSTSFNC